MQENLYLKILTSIDEGIYFVDQERRITFWNKGAENITGFKASEVVGSYCYDNILNHIDDQGNHLCMGACPLNKTIQDGQPRSINIYLHHKDGHRLPVNVRSVQIKENNQVIGAVELFSDNSYFKTMSNDLEELSTIALHDQLTELPNRRYLDSFLQSKFAEYHQLGINFGLIFMDIDHFKVVNDNYGHEAGDQTLKMVASTLQSTLRSTDLLARYGGEEFVAVMQINTMDALEKVANKLRLLVENSNLRSEKNSIHVTISLGCTLVSSEDTIPSLIKRADLLMYSSKNNGRNQITLG